jgi:hypothetical protein
MALVDSASNRNEYQEYFLWGKGGQCIRLTTLPSSCADCLEIWEPQPTGTLTACPGLLMGLLYASFYVNQESHANCNVPEAGWQYLSGHEA